jgi:hypothetical protein
MPITQPHLARRMFTSAETLAQPDAMVISAQQYEGDLPVAILDVSDPEGLIDATTKRLLNGQRKAYVSELVRQTFEACGILPLTSKIKGRTPREDGR